MIYVLTFLHIIVSLILIAVVLLQTGKRADLAGAFGGGGSQTAFGTRGAATLLSKMTTGAAIIFMLTSIGLSILSSKSGSTSQESVLGKVDETETSTPAPTDQAPAGLPEMPTSDTTDQSVPAESPAGESTPDNPPADSQQP